MTITTSTNKAVHTGDAIIVEFAYTFRMDHDEDMDVYLDETQQSSGFTVARNPDNIGGTVTFAVAPASGVLVTLLRVIDQTQETDYVPYDPFPAESHEDALDKLTMLVQQLQEEVDRNTQAIGSGSGVVTVAPPFEANRAWKWSTGTPEAKLINSAYDPDEQAALAQASAIDAADSASEALGSQNKAEQWAQEAEDVPVEPNEYSAYHWSQKAAALVGQKVYDTVLDMAQDSTLAIGDFVRTKGYLVAGDGGGNDYEIVAAGTGTDDGGSFIDIDTHQAQGLFPDEISPLHFGAAGDGIADDGLEIINAAIFFRTTIAAQSAAGANNASVVVFDLKGKLYRTTHSLDFTKIVSWGWVIQNGAFIGECTGKAIMDTIGSRGGRLSNVLTYGSKTSMPTRGIQAARSSEAGYGFCDNMMYDNCTTFGYFSVAGFHAYGQETTHYDHCRWWNANPLARNAIYEGYDTFPMNSDYTTLVVGAQSYIQNKYTNVDHRYFDSETTAAISGITKANPAVVTTATAHNLETGNIAAMFVIAGMTELNNTTHAVTVLSPTTYQLDGVDSTGYGTFTSGTSIRGNEVPPVYMSRMKQHVFDACYIVSYGQPHIEYGFPDTQNPVAVDLDILYEGVGGDSTILFTGVDSVGAIELIDFNMRTYAANAQLGILATDAVTNVLSFKSSEMKVDTFSGHALPAPLIIPSQEPLFAMYGASIYCPLATNFDYTQLDYFSGSVAYGDKTQVIDVETDGTLVDVSGDIIVESQIGTLGGYTISGATAKLHGNTVNLYIGATITDIGDGSGGIDITLPWERSTFVTQAIGSGRHLSDGSMLQSFLVGTTQTRLLKYNNTSPITANGMQFQFSLTYERA